jgi:pimeloyl-ACP methyl ester carboxylesterase
MIQIQNLLVFNKAKLYIILIGVFMFSLAQLDASNFVIDKKVQYIKVKDINIGYREFGSGQALIFITAYGTTMDLWPPKLIEKLSKTHRVIIFDNRGAGDTSEGNIAFSIEQFAKDTSMFMDALNIDNADILGWSMGGMIALQLAVYDSDKINKLIIYGSGCGGEAEFQPSQEIINKLMAQVSGKAEAKKMFTLMFPKKWRKEHPDFENIFPHVKETVKPKIVQKQGEAIGKWSGINDKLKNFTKPVLIIFGAEDIIVPAANGVILNEKIKKSKLIIIKESGHGLMFQLDEKFSNKINKFLSSVN